MAAEDERSLENLINQAQNVSRTSDNDPSQLDPQRASLLERITGSVTPGLRDAAIAAGLVLASTYVLPEVQRRFEMFRDFYTRDAKGDLKSHHGDELAAILMYGDPNRHKQQPEPPYKFIHSLLTMPCAALSVIDNIPIVKQLFHGLVGYTAQSAQNKASQMFNRFVGGNYSSSSAHS